MHDKGIEAAARALGYSVADEVGLPRPDKILPANYSDAQAAIAPYLAQCEADGFVMVPVEPSETMLDAGDEVIGMPWGSVIPPSANPAHYIMGMVWQQMIAACPKVAHQELNEVWQPIETAPRDGTPFLAWCDAWQGEINGIKARSFAAVIAGKPGISDRCKNPVWWPSDGDAYAVWVRATHWMPLPVRPKVAP